MLLKNIGKIWKDYLVGQFLVTIFVFLMTWGAGAVTGLQYPLVNALAAGILESLPNFGSVISVMLSGILALVFGSSRIDIPNWQFMILIAVCLILIQVLQNLLISPLIIGKQMNIHPLVVFSGMIIFSFFFGIWGMILAVPIIGTIRELYNFAKQNKSNTGHEDKLQKL